MLTHLTDRRRGPSVAPRTHMGRPVCAASNNFTTTSPVGKKQQENLSRYEKCMLLFDASGI